MLINISLHFFSNTYIKVCWRKKCSPALKWEFLFVPFSDRLMDDVSLSHLEIDFICNKIRGEAVAFSNYTGIFLIQQQYGKNCITDIPILGPLNSLVLFFLSWWWQVVTFFAKMCQKTQVREVLLFSTSNVRFLQKMKIASFLQKTPCRRNFS